MDHAQQMRDRRVSVMECPALDELENCLMSGVQWPSRLPWHLGLVSLVVGASGAVLPVQAQPAPYCQQSPDGISQKETLRQAAIAGGKEAQKRYQAIVAQQATALQQCRRRSWLKTSAIWLRLYPCDAQPGTLDAVLDKIVNRGYNQINVEVFYSGKILLPPKKNPTPWVPVMLGSGMEQVDLLDQVIRKGRERGLKVYAWMFSLNFGMGYLQRSDKTAAMARNGLGQTSLTAPIAPGVTTEMGMIAPEEAFIDPYSPQAQRDYAALVQAVLRYKPDGVLFDYLRYPRGAGAASVAARVQDLWVYGDASQRSLLQRATNYKGMELIQRFLNKGQLTAQDLQDANQLYPKDKEARWQGLDPAKTAKNLPIDRQAALLQGELWRLSVSHAFQGILNFLVTAATPVQNQGIPTGAVFFPDGNNAVPTGGYDSRLQFWQRFPSSMEWHPMAYATCGRVDCVVAQVQKVLQQAPPGVKVMPVLAGIWQQTTARPPLEVQMEAIRKVAPTIDAISHFAYSWQEPGSDRDRKYCQP